MRRRQYINTYMYQPYTGHKQAPLTASTEIDFNRLHSTPLPQQCKYNGYDPDLNITFLVLYRDSYNQLSSTRVEENFIKYSSRREFNNHI